MPATNISICNLALSWLGGNIITSLQDDSTEAKLCSANFDSSRDAALEDGDWSFAIGRCIPAKLSEPPAFGFSAQYQLPKNPLCLRVIDVSKSPDFLDPLNVWVKEGDRILCNYEAIYIRCIQQVVDTTRFSPGFVQTCAARLAADICVPLTHDKDLFAYYWQLYKDKKMEALAVDGMQGINKGLRSTQLLRVR